MLNATSEFVTQRRPFVVHGAQEVQIGAADSTPGNPHQYFTHVGCGHQYLAQVKLKGGFAPKCSHRSPLTRVCACISRGNCKGKGGGRCAAPLCFPSLP